MKIIFMMIGISLLYAAFQTFIGFERTMIAAVSTIISFQCYQIFFKDN